MGALEGSAITAVRIAGVNHEYATVPGVREDVLDILSIPLLGIIPESMDVLRASNIGAPVTLADARSAPALAYFDAARRLAGENVPITIPGEKRGLLDKIFARRAA